MAATALKSPSSSASDRNARPADVVAADREQGSDSSGVRLRVVIASEQLRAMCEAVEGAATIEVAATVLGYESNNFALKAGSSIIIEFRHERDETHRSSALNSESLIEHLTPREREVLELIAEGLSNRAIAERLGNSEHTVKFHVSSLLGKLGAVTRAELVGIAIRRGLIMI